MFTLVKSKVRKKLVFAIRHAEDKSHHHQYKEYILFFKPQSINKPIVTDVEQKHQERQGYKRTVKRLLKALIAFGDKDKGRHYKNDCPRSYVC